MRAADPYRWDAPLALTERAIDRTRLTEILDGRFERRLTVVQGPAGSGKTTLLCQSIARNLADPVGVDCWLSCQAGDDREAALAEGIFGALRVEDDGRPPHELIADAIWSRSPQAWVLMLDDVQHLRPGGSGARLLERILASLPDNGRMVLATRTAPPFGITRALAAGEAVVVTDAELAFDASEQSDFLADRGLETAFDLGGWPAGLELAATIGRDRIADYLWEEILERTDDARLRRLARLAPLDWIDDERVTAVAGGRESTAELVSGLPLVVESSEGAVRLHALWGPVLERIDPEWKPDELARSIDFLCEAGAHREALALSAAAGGASHVESIVASFAGCGRWTGAKLTQLESMLEALPAPHRSDGCGRLLEGLCLLHVSPPGSLPNLLSAREAFREAGAVELEIAALTALQFIAFFAGSSDMLRRLIGIASELEHPVIEPLCRLGEANACLLEGRAEEALLMHESVRGLGLDIQSLDAASVGLAALDAGRPDRAIAGTPKLPPSAPAVVRAFMRTTLVEARWLLGRPEEGDLRGLVGSEGDEAGHLHNQVVFAAVVAFQNAALGREIARDQLADLHRRAADVDLGPRAQMAIAGAEMMWALAEGRSSEASRIMTSALRAAPDPIRFHRHSLRALPALYVIDASWREEIDALPLGACHAEGRRAARALVALRERGDAGPSGALDWRRAGELRAYFVPEMMAELAIGAVTAGSGDAEVALRELAAAHRGAVVAVRDAAPRAQAKVAKRILSAVPRRPDGEVEIGLLGPLELWRDGVRVDESTLGRSRVRALLQLLAWRGAMTRQEIQRELWPDLEDSSAANNLRVNLNHVLRLLEPDRDAGEPSYLVESEGARVVLRCGDGLTIDADAFDREVDEATALEREGRAGEALRVYERAIRRYRGDFLADGMDPGWGELERTRYRSRFVRSATRVASLQLGRGAFDEALRAVHRALDADDLAESAYRVEGLIYFRAGDRSAARRALGGALERLSASGLSPGEDLLRLCARVGIKGED